MYIDVLIRNTKYNFANLLIIILFFLKCPLWVVNRHNNPIASDNVYLNPSVNGGSFGGTNINQI